MFGKRLLNSNLVLTIKECFEDVFEGEKSN